MQVVQRCTRLGPKNVLYTALKKNVQKWRKKMTIEEKREKKRMKKGVLTTPPARGGRAQNPRCAPAQIPHIPPPLEGQKLSNGAAMLRPSR